MTEKKCFTLSGNETAQIAFNLIQTSENNLTKRPSHNIKFDWKEFLHLSLTWVISGFIILLVLIIVTMSSRSALVLEKQNSSTVTSSETRADDITLPQWENSLFKDIVLRTDTISLVFSLVVSAGLEQVWNNKKRWYYKITQIGELLLAFVGLIVYLTYSLWDIYDFTNFYYINRFGFNLIYVVFCVLFVLVGFAVRSINDLEE